MEDNKELKVINPNSLLNLSKNDLRGLAKTAIQSVHDGWVEPLTALITVKKTQELLSAMEDDLKPLANDKTYEKGYAEHNVEVSQSMLGVKYSFLECEDEEWNELNRQMLELKTKKDEREKFLKSLTKPLTEVDEDTGEVKKIYPPVKSGSLGLVLKIK